MKRKLILLLFPFLLAGCVVHVNVDSSATAGEVPKELSYIVEDLKSRNFDLEADMDDDDEIDTNTVISWIEAELENQEEYSLITFKSNEDAEKAFETMKQAESLDLEKQTSEQEGIFIQTDIEDGSVEAMILHENHIVIGEREDGNLDALIQQFTDWKLK